MGDDIIHDIGSAEDETNEFYHKWLDGKADVKDLSRKLEEARGTIVTLVSLHADKDARIAELTDLESEARFLVDRLCEWEADGCDCDRGNREWTGHVSPSLARLEGILSVIEGKPDA